MRADDLLMERPRTLIRSGRKVVLYNAGGVEPLTTVTLPRALRQLHRGVVRVLEADPDGVRVGPWPLPLAVELTRYVYPTWDDLLRVPGGVVVFSRPNLLRRDDYRCAYCARAATTIDHVLPRSRGGPTSWLNCVAACMRCNAIKRDRTPAEASMRLDITPWAPSRADLMGRRSTFRSLAADPVLVPPCDTKHQDQPRTSHADPTCSVWSWS